MKATLLMRRREYLRVGTFAEILVWCLPVRVPGSDHDYKYALALVDMGVCVLRFDNETSKGDHLHRGDAEFAYRFTGIDDLLAAFDGEIRNWLDGHTDHR